ATSSATLPRPILDAFLRVLAPYAPHLAEELWARLGAADLIAHATWPPHDAKLCEDETIELAVQVNGKRRAAISVPRDADAGLIERLALQSDGVVRILDGRAPRKVIVVPGRLVNIVA